jgi:hypothetical protein
VCPAFLACQNWSNDKAATLPENFQLPHKISAESEYSSRFSNFVTFSDPSSALMATTPDR